MCECPCLSMEQEPSSDRATADAFDSTMSTTGAEGTSTGSLYPDKQSHAWWGTRIGRGHRQGGFTDTTSPAIVSPTDTQFSYDGSQGSIITTLTPSTANTGEGVYSPSESDPGNIVSLEEQMVSPETGDDESQLETKGAKAIVPTLPLDQQGVSASTSTSVSTVIPMQPQQQIGEHDKAYRKRAKKESLTRIRTSSEGSTDTRSTDDTVTELFGMGTKQTRGQTASESYENGVIADSDNLDNSVVDNVQVTGVLDHDTHKMVSSGPSTTSTGTFRWLSDEELKVTRKALHEMEDRLNHAGELGDYCKSIFRSLQVMVGQTNSAVTLSELQGAIVDAKPILEQFTEELTYCFLSMNNDQWKRTRISMSPVLEEYMEIFDSAERAIYTHDLSTEKSQMEGVSFRLCADSAIEKLDKAEDELLNFCRDLRLRITQGSRRVIPEPLHDIPFLRPYHMRRKYLNDLCTTLQNSKIVCLCGPAGSGKTSIVAEFVYAKIFQNMPDWVDFENQGKHFDHVIWISMDRYPDNMETVEIQLLICQDLLKALGLTCSEEVSCLQDFHEQLRSATFDGKLCIVFDNIENILIEGVVNGLCQHAIKCSVLVTGRKREIMEALCCYRPDKKVMNVDYVPDPDLLRTFLIYRCCRDDNNLGAVEDTSLRELVGLSQGCLLGMDILGGIALICRQWSWARIIEYITSCQKPTAGGALRADVSLNVEKIIVAALNLAEPDSRHSKAPSLFKDMLYLLAGSSHGIFKVDTLYFLFEHSFGVEKSVVDIFLEWISELSLIVCTDRPISQRQEDESASVVMPLSVLKVLKAYLASRGQLGTQYEVLLSAYGSAVTTDKTMSYIPWYCTPASCDEGVALLDPCTMLARAEIENYEAEICQIMMDYEWIKKVIQVRGTRFLLYSIRTYGLSDEACFFLDKCLRSILRHGYSSKKDALGVALISQLLSRPRKLRKLPPLKNLASSILRSNDSFQLVSGSLVRPSSNWMSLSGSHSGAVTSMCSIKNWLISGDVNGDCKLWNVRDGVCYHHLRPQNHGLTSIHHVNISSNTQLICVCGSAGKIVLWHACPGGTLRLIHETRVKALKRHTHSNVWCSAFSDTSGDDRSYPKHLAVGGNIVSPGGQTSGIVNVFDIVLEFHSHSTLFACRGEMQLRYILKAHPLAVTSIHFLQSDGSNSEMLVTYSKDHGSASIWRLDNLSSAFGSEVRVAPERNFEYDTLILFYNTEFLQLWDFINTSNGTIMGAFFKQSSSVQIWFSREVFLSETHSKYACSREYILERPQQDISSFLLTRAASDMSDIFIVTGSSSGTLQVWQLTSETSQGMLPLYYYDTVTCQGGISVLKTTHLEGSSINNCYILSGSMNGSIALWNISRKQCLKTVARMPGPIELMCGSLCKSSLEKSTRYVHMSSGLELSSMGLPSAEVFEKPESRRTPMASFSIADEEYHGMEESLIATAGDKAFYAALPQTGKPITHKTKSGLSLRIRNVGKLVANGDLTEQYIRTIKYPLLECPKDAYVNTSTAVYSFICQDTHVYRRQYLAAVCEQPGPRNEKLEFVLVWELFPEGRTFEAFYEQLVIPVKCTLKWESQKQSTDGAKAIGNAVLNVQEWAPNPFMQFSTDSKYVLYCKGSEQYGGGIFVWDLRKSNSEPAFLLKLGMRNTNINYLRFSGPVITGANSEPTYYVAGVCRHSLFKTLVALWKVADVQQNEKQVSKAKRITKTLVPTCEWKMDSSEHAPPIAFGECTYGNKTFVNIAWGDQSGTICLHTVDLQTREGDKTSVPENIGSIPSAHNSPITTLQFFDDVSPLAETSMRQYLVSTGADKKICLWSCTLARGFQGKGYYASCECLHWFRADYFPSSCSKPLCINRGSSAASPTWEFDIGLKTDDALANQSDSLHAILRFTNYPQLDVEERSDDVE